MHNFEIFFNGNLKNVDDYIADVSVSVYVKFFSFFYTIVNNLFWKFRYLNVFTVGPIVGISIKSLKKLAKWRKPGCTGKKKPMLKTENDFLFFF